jgi:hypothetical protein
MLELFETPQSSGANTLEQHWHQIAEVFGGPTKSPEQNLAAARKETLDLANQVITDASMRQAFAKNLQAFEARAGNDKITAQQIADTYGQLTRILKLQGDSPLRTQERETLVDQFAAHLAKPDQAWQGYHMSCGWDFNEYRMLKRDPDKIANYVADIAEQGKVKAPTNLGHDDVPIDPKSLRPDDESQNFPPRPTNRDYFSQIAQVGMISLHWYLTKWGPDGKRAPAHEYQFEQRQNVYRPRPEDTDLKPQHNDTGERLVDKKGKIIGDSEGNAGGWATADDIQEVYKAFTNRSDRFVLEYRNKNNSNTSIKASSLAEFEAELAKNKGQFPLGLAVNAAQSPLKETYMQRHPERTDMPAHSGHFVGVMSADLKNHTAVMWNPWGEETTVSTATLLELMKAMYSS